MITTLWADMIGLLDHLPKIRESVTTPDGLFMQVRAKNKHRIEKLIFGFPNERQTTNRKKQNPDRTQEL
ncbi:MAG: hypothetical protein V8R80_09930 [Eubacterium sp.]